MSETTSDQHGEFEDLFRQAEKLRGRCESLLHAWPQSDDRGLSHHPRKDPHWMEEEKQLIIEARKFFSETATRISDRVLHDDGCFERTLQLVIDVIRGYQNWVTEGTKWFLSSEWETTINRAIDEVCDLIRSVPAIDEQRRGGKTAVLQFKRNMAFILMAPIHFGGTKLSDSWRSLRNR